MWQNLRDKTLLLASRSPRRQQLLRDLEVPFEVRVIEVEESFPDTLPAEEVAEYLARKKAEQGGSLAANEWLLTADTTVVLQDQILNKPEDAAEATTMLQQLSGRQHAVITGVCLRSVEKLLSFSVKTQVTFKTLSEQEIEHYITQYQPFDKAGAYGIQEWIGQIGITHLEGSYFNVVGLPTAELARVLQEL